MTQEGKTDLRVQKTERALTDALSTLLKEKPIEKITVSDLCGEAMIRRATFYSHFRDKYDFLDFCLKRRQAEMTESLCCSGSTDMAGHYADMVRSMLRFLTDNQAMLDKSSSHPETANIMAIVERQMTQQIQAKADFFADHGGQLIAPPEVVSAFFTGAMLGVAKWWFKSDTATTEDELIVHIQQMTAACIQAFADKKEEPDE